LYSAYGEEATAMTLVGCDLHARKQQVAVLDAETGEVQEVELSHQGKDVERFYAALPRPVTVAVESTGYALWFHALMRQLGHTLLVGNAAKIRAMVVRKTKTDRRDALHLLDLLKHDRLSGCLILRRAICVPCSRIGCGLSACGRWSPTDYTPLRSATA
jgi:transposase